VVCERGDPETSRFFLSLFSLLFLAGLFAKLFHRVGELWDFTDLAGGRKYEGDVSRNGYPAWGLSETRALNCEQGNRAVSRVTEL
jgi:hypothetical protein